MEVTLLQFTWFSIIGIALALYAILDGFDLGAAYILGTSLSNQALQGRYL